MDLKQVLSVKVKQAVQELFDAELPSVEFQPTRKDFEAVIIP